MDHIIERNGRHQSDILLYAMAAGDPVYPSRLEHPGDSGERYAEVKESAEQLKRPSSY